MRKLNIGLFNDSFPPTIDGVAQTVKNYATVLQQNHCNVTVVTPEYKGVEDRYPFEVFRWTGGSAIGRAIPSIPIRCSSCGPNGSISCTSTLPSPPPCW